jgi:hypothetical protein
MTTNGIAPSAKSLYLILFVSLLIGLERSETTKKKTISLVKPGMKFPLANSPRAKQNLAVL